MNPHDDDRAPRSQVTLRLDRELIDRIDGVARDEGVDRTELVRRLLADGLTHHQMTAALNDYAAGRRSAWSAAAMAGVELYEMLDRIAEAGIPYTVDPDALEQLRAGSRPPPSGSTPPPATSSPGSSRAAAPPVEEAVIDQLRAQYRPATTRVLFIGESSPAGGTHFYLANSNLYRATREAFGTALTMARPPEGEPFLAWFRDVGCWLVDLADRPVDRSAAGPRAKAVDAGIPGLAATLREVRPERIIVVLRRIAPAVREAARIAGVDEGTIDVLPFPTRQWRPVYVTQLAAIVGEILGGRARSPEQASGGRAIAESPAAYGTPGLHEVMADVLRAHAGTRMTASAIAREIAARDLWRRPSDGGHPPGSQVSARARHHPELFQTSDLGIRLRPR